jgi:hypothetical protein
MKATKSQLSIISLKLHLNRDYVDWIDELFKKVPKNNEKYQDERVDYTRMILSDMLSDMTSSQADYVIKAYNGIRGYSLLKSRNIIISLLDK